MTAPPSADFLQGLQSSKALDAGQLRLALEYAYEGPPDPRHLGRELLRRGWMTAYQINQVFLGRAQHLTLGPYLVLERLGHGGMGEVLKARHTRMGRLVALKVIRADRLARTRAVARFEREVQTVARLDHPNIVHAYDAGVLDDALFLAMEYLEGTDLKRLVRAQGPLPAATACEYARQAAEGLQHACERGVVHRDVKPSNLFLTARGEVVKLLDMGLARLLEEEANLLTRRGVPLGTASYQAPEQILDAGAADARSDLYGLGCTLYFC
jgi:serine/threonine protein kinase